MREGLLHHYRRARDWQRESYGNSGLHLPDGQGGFRDARQFTGGGAAYGFHASAAYWSARRAIFAQQEAREFLSRGRLRRAGGRGR